MRIYLELLVFAMGTALITAGLHWLERKTRFGELSYMARQVICGAALGLAAVIGTERGVEVYGAVANVRDAAPLCAGFFFGGPAGIIAGVIGGLERWLSVYWGGGEFTRIACSVSTLLAGFYAAMIRTYICGRRQPSWLMGAAAGVVMEAFHLLMVFLTNTDNLSLALIVVRKLTLPMMLMTAMAVALAYLFVFLIDHVRGREAGKKRISERMRVVLLSVFFIFFLITSVTMERVQIRMAEKDTFNVMQLGVWDLMEDIRESNDQSLLKASKVIASMMDRNQTRSLAELANNYNLTEVHIVNRNGVITASTDIDYIEFDLSKNPAGQRIMGMFSRYGNSALPFDYASFKSGQAEDARQYAFYEMRSGGFALVGVDEEALHRMRAETISSLVINRHIQVGGFFLTAELDGTSILSDDMPNLTELSGVKKETYEKTGVLQRTTIYGEDCYFLSTEFEGFYLMGVLPAEEALESCYLDLYIVMFIQIIIYAILYALVYKLLERMVVKPISNVNASLDKITDGDLQEQVEERSSLEFDSLSDGINHTVDTLKHYIAEAEGRIEQELLLAKDIQRSVLPSVFPPYPDSHEYRIYAEMDPARSVGGDFYDIFRLDGKRLAFIAADVSGKGIPAAMFMMTAKTMIRNLMESGMSPADAFTAANDRLCEGNDAEMFVTAWMGVLNVENGQVVYVNAGHNPPLLYRNEGGFSYLRTSPGFVLAGLPGIPYKSGELQLAPGEKLFLYTDGAPEAVNPELVQYGEDRLEAFVNAHADEDPEQLIPALREDIEAFCAGADQFDDITMLELVYTGDTEKQA